MARIRKNGEHGRKRGNGSGTLMKSGNFYYVLWYSVDENGKRRRHCQSTKTGDLEKAREYLASMCDEFSIDKALDDREAVAKKVRHAIGDLAYERAEIDDKKPALALDAAWEKFERSTSRPRSGEATFRNYQQWFNLFVAWVQANHEDVKEMREVTASLASEYATHLLGRVRGTTFNRHMNALALVWRHVAADFNDVAKLKVNPFAWNKSSGTGIRRVTLNHAERPHKRRDLNLDEIAQLLATATGELRVLIALGFYGGWRLADCALLDWGKVDRVNGLVVLRSKKTDEETKTRLHPALIRIIEEEVKTKSGYLLPETAALYNSGTTGRVKLVRQLQSLFESVGIECSTKEEGKRARPDCGFHSLRHAFVTQLERVGATLHERQALAGHASSAMTEYYTHDDGSPVLALPDLTNGVPETAKTPLQNAPHEERLLGRADVADAQKPVFDAVCAMLGNLEPQTLRAIAGEALRQAKLNETKTISTT